jgi:EmrB/QacA subfamily drug resistance transporter
MTKTQRRVLTISILASFIAFLDGSVINVALPAIAKDLGGGFTTQQWVVDAYLLTLGSLILVAGSLSDLLGRQKILVVGLVSFGIASLLCAAAPSSPFLIFARAVQGIGGALIVPSSLALIISAFKGESQGKAIGTWTAWTGIAFIIGPLLGGTLVDAGSWRWIFAINIVPIAVTLWLLQKLSLSEKHEANVQIDIRGAALCAVGLGATVYALIEQPHYGWDSPMIFVTFIVGIASLAVFLWHERRTRHPMLPLSLFKVRNFSFGNAATLAIYSALSVGTLLISVFIQQVSHYSATAAGLALIPVTLIMFFMSSRFGALAGKYGPRLFMTVGPILAGIGYLTMLQMNASLHYLTDLLPGVLLFGLGLSITVAPLTSAVLGSIDSSQSGIGSAVNNAIARIAGLLAIAFIGLVTGPHLTTAGFHRGIIVTATLLFAGGVVSLIGIRNLPRNQESVPIKL